MSIFAAFLSFMRLNSGDYVSFENLCNLGAAFYFEWAETKMSGDDDVDSFNRLLIGSFGS